MPRLGDNCCTPSGTSDHKVLVDEADTTPEFLAAKLAGSGGITLTIENVGANEFIQIDGSGVVRPTGIVWRSDGAGTATTWADVMAAIAAAAPVPQTILCNLEGDALEIPASGGAPWACGGAELVGSTEISFQGGAVPSVTCDDGAQVADLIAIRGSIRFVPGTSTAGAPLFTFSVTDAPCLQVSDGAFIQQTAVGSGSVQVPSGQNFLLDVTRGAIVEGPSGAHHRFVLLVAGATLTLRLTVEGIALQLVDGPAGATYVVQQDGSAQQFGIVSNLAPTGGVVLVNVALGSIANLNGFALPDPSQTLPGVFSYDESTDTPLFNSASLGTWTSLIGPTGPPGGLFLTASFVQPAQGATVVAAVSGSGIAVGDSVSIGRFDLYVVTALGTNTATLFSMGVDNATAPGSVVGGAGLVVSRASGAYFTVTLNAVGTLVWKTPTTMSEMFGAGVAPSAGGGSGGAGGGNGFAGATGGGGGGGGGGAPGGSTCVQDVPPFPCTPGGTLTLVVPDGGAGSAGGAAGSIPAGTAGSGGPTTITDSVLGVVVFAGQGASNTGGVGAAKPAAGTVGLVAAAGTGGAGGVAGARWGLVSGAGENGSVGGAGGTQAGTGGSTGGGVVALNGTMFGQNPLLPAVAGGQPGAGAGGVQGGGGGGAAGGNAGTASETAIPGYIASGGAGGGGIATGHGGNGNTGAGATAGANGVDGQGGRGGGGGQGGGGGGCTAAGGAATAGGNGGKGSRGYAQMMGVMP